MAALARAARALRGGTRGGSGAAAVAAGSPPHTGSSPPHAGSHGEDDVWALQRKHPDWHGFSGDAASDALNMRGVFVGGVSVAIVLGSAFLHYLPDYGLRQWARREAERQLRAREAQGLPLVTPRYYEGVGGAPAP